jgi:outer membrane lipoprotein-sorting protein
MSKICPYLLILSLMWAQSLFGQSVTEKHLTAKDIVERVESNLRGKNNYGVYSMTVKTPNWERTLSLEAWDDRAKHRAFIKINSPPKDKDTLFLRVAYNLWMYHPQIEKVIKIPPSMMLQPWMGSDFNNDDLVKESSLIQDYTHRIVTKEKLDHQEALQIELLPKPEAPVVWGKILYWVTPKEFLPLREQFFDERGNVVKEMKFYEVKTMAGRNIPTLYVMTSTGKPGHQTTLTIHKIRFDQKFDDDIFSLKNLRRGR